MFKVWGLWGFGMSWVWALGFRVVLGFRASGLRAYLGPRVSKGILYGSMTSS